MKLTQHCKSTILQYKIKKFLNKILIFFKKVIKKPTGTQGSFEKKAQKTSRRELKYLEPKKKSCHQTMSRGHCFWYHWTLDTRACTLATNTGNQIDYEGSVEWYCSEPTFNRTYTREQRRLWASSCWPIIVETMLPPGLLIPSGWASQGY